MLFYNGGPVDWFYDGLKTEEEMRADGRYSKLFEVPCVLYDNGYGKVYEFDTLEHVCSKMAVPYSDSAAQYSFQCVMAFLDGTYNAPGVDQVYDIAYEARNTAKDAIASANPQLITFARMAVLPMAEGMTVAQGASVSTLWPEKRVGDTVKLKDFFWYEGELYRCNQPELTITEGQTPDMNLPALYGHVSVAPDGVLIWDADDLTGAPDIYNTGVRVHYPDADGPIYVSKRDGNTSTPGTDQWWTLEE